MGVTIHYSFKLKEPASLKRLIDELKDICESMGWKNNIINQSKIETLASFECEQIRFKEDDIMGIVFSPNEKCEPVWLTFLPNGRTSAIPNLTFFDYTANNEMLYWVFTKTQFAGVETHKTIVKLLQYLSTRYFIQTEVDDETGYWETGDENMLKEKMGFLNGAITAVSEIFRNLEKVEGESIDGLADRLEAILKKNSKDFNNGQ